MTIGYFDGTALATLLSPGSHGDTAASIWASLDAICAQTIVEYELPSVIGRSLNRMAWVWTVNSLTLVDWTAGMQSTAIDLCWLGAPAIGATHIACAEALDVDHFVTSDEVTASWASIRGLSVVSLRE